MSLSYTVPNVVATEDIRPFRVVTAQTSDFSVAESDADEIPLGVSGGSTKRYNSTLHAEAGDPVELQTGSVVRVAAGGNIAVGARVKSDANGAVVTVTTSGTGIQEIVGVALEAAASGEIVQIKWQPHAYRHALA